MMGRVKLVTTWSVLCGGVVLAAVLVLTRQSAETQMADPVPPVERVSVRSDGGEGNGNSSGSVASSDGKCVAFYSDATNLLPQGAADVDTNGYRDVYLYDRDAKTLQRASLSSSGVQANGPSQAQGFRPAIDGDCTCVAFSSDATNLVPDDTNGRTDVFVRDLAASPATTLRVSVGDDGEANGPSSFPSVSGDCQLIAFQSNATNLVADDGNQASDVFVYNRGTGLTTRVSVGPGGVSANGANITPAISSDGRCVAFASAATNLWPGDTNGTMDVYVACDGAITCRASVDSTGIEGNDISFLPALSSDGRYVAFKSNASNLVPDDRNTVADVFVHDCETGVTERVSVSGLGEEGNDIAIPPSISGDGRFVAFGSYASNLLPGQNPRGRSQVYVRDRTLGTTVLISTTPSGAPGNNSVPDLPPSISLDGGYVAFASLASNLVPGDTNQSIDAFIRQNVTVTPIGTRTPTPLPTRTATEPIPCDRDTDCPVGQVCQDQVCVPAPTPTPTIACETNDDCPAGQTCVDGVCRDLSTPTPTATPLPMCMMDSDCPEGTHCRAMVCVPPRECSDENPELDRVNCRGVRETCVDGTCECGGDCNKDGIVFGAELTKMVCILGGGCSLSECQSGDFDGDGLIMGNELTLAVRNLGLGCPGEGAPLIFAQDRTGETRTIVVNNVDGIPGQFVDMQFLVSGGGEITTTQLDLLYPTSVLDFDLEDPASQCTIADRLNGTFLLEAFAPQVPATPAGQGRLRLLVWDRMFPARTYTAGPIATCRFRVKPGAAVGSSTLSAERFQIADMDGNPFSTEVSLGSVTVDEPGMCTDNTECPSGTECVDGVCRPIGGGECSGPTAGPTECKDGREACVNNQCACVGDCNGDGRVRSSEITQMIRIINGQAGIEVCPSADFNGDGRVRSSEVTLAIRNINEGCPQ
jgi:Tol biopolymer transport system component